MAVNVCLRAVLTSAYFVYAACLSIVFSLFSVYFIAVRLSSGFISRLRRLLHIVFCLFPTTSLPSTALRLVYNNSRL